jgi:hypothetical protein
MIPDPIILSDDKSAGAESRTNYSTPDVDLIAKSGSDPLYVADNNGFALGAVFISDCLVADHQDNDNNNNSNIIDNT